MALRDLTRRFESDPLLKVGVGAMIVALGFTVVVAVAASLERPMEPAAAKPEVKSATEPLVRSDPGVDPWVEKDIPTVRTEVSPRPPSVSQPEHPPDAKPDLGSRSGSSPSEGFGAEAPRSGYDQVRSGQTLPLDGGDYPLPTNEQIQAAHRPRHYH